MSWFSEQILQRKQQDDIVFRDSMSELVSSVTGRSEAAAFFGITSDNNESFNLILRFFGIKDKEIPSSLTNIDDKLDYIFRPDGIMYRKVELKGNWYKDAYGPLLAKRKDDSRLVALLPKINGYVFFDDVKGKNITLTPKNAKLFDSDAFVFYKPFPLRKLNLGDILKYMAKSIDLNDILSLCFAAFGATCVGLLFPFFNRYLFSTAVESKSISVLLSIAVFMVFASFSRILLGIVRDIATLSVGTKISIGSKAAAVMRMLSLPVGFFKNYSSGELSERIDYISSFCSCVVNCAFSLGITGLFSLIYIGQIFFLTPALMPVALSVILITFVLSTIAGLWQMKISRQRMLYTSQNGGLSFALISGVEKIRLAGAEKRAFANWAKSYGKQSRFTYDIPFFLKINTAVNSAVNLAGTLIIYYTAVKNHIAIPDYYAFLTSFGMVSAAFATLSSIILTAADAKPMLDMFMPILKEEPELTQNKQVLTHLRGKIEINNVSFTYKEGMPSVIKNFSLNIKPGEYVALVGESASGKSTLFKLLLGFEKPQTGAIYFDNTDIQNIDMRSVRRQIGIVMQSEKLFRGDIYSNIALTAPSLTMDEAWEAAETAGIAEDIRQMPMGMFTLITENNSGISGGQRQRLLIARALASKPKILMFDEATSALDNITQKKISQALDKLKCTRIVIAHRLSTVMECDRIIVIKEGSIAEEGTYKELSEKNGVFAQLVKRQKI
ncbi:MAG: ATP-binding cassette domain-containing protein [Firmicutes bacterium]|nr:ATP-binding cassette domain-containing protein [Bacillota bacterium]